MRFKSCRFFLITILLILIKNPIFGQDKHFSPEWNVGVNFGSNMSSASFATISSNQPFKTKMWPQFTGGITARYLSEKHLGIIAEINYIQQGWKQDFKDVDRTEAEQMLLNSYEYQHQLNYLEIPILTHIYFGNKVRFFINLGPKIAFLLSGKEKLNDALATGLSDGTFPSWLPTEQYFLKAQRKFDYGLVGGLGVEFRTGIGNFLVEGRYGFGLGDFFKSSKSDPFQRSANRNITIKATYLIKLF